MTRTLDDYLGKITPWQSTKPNFVATVAATVAPVADASAVVASIPASFDIDTAVGDQLDKDGEYIGRDRYVRVPLPTLYFSWDDPLRGWDQGEWRGPYEAPVSITALDDDTYRRLLKARILANRWDGTNPGAQAILNAFLIDPDTLVSVQDGGRVSIPRQFFSWDTMNLGWDMGDWRGPNEPDVTEPVFDMTVTVVIAGKIPPLMTIALLQDNALPITSGGVSLDYSITSVDQAPVFAWDVTSDLLAGWDAGAWGVPPNYFLNLESAA